MVCYLSNLQQYHLRLRGLRASLLGQAKNKRTKVKYVIILLLSLVICASATARTSTTSWASWYGPGLYGNTMSCGKVLTAQTWGVANKTLPCGTRIHMCFRGLCTNVTVVDRGPFVANRDFDLTAAVAGYLSFQGVAKIEWNIIGRR